MRFYFSTVAAPRPLCAAMTAKIAEAIDSQANLYAQNALALPESPAKWA
jgi:hypothetical protein